MEGTENETGETVSRVAHAREIAPGVGGIAGVNADGITMHAAHRFARHFVARRAAEVAEDELIGGERHRFANGARRDAIGERGGGGFRGLGGSGLENREAELIDPVVIGLPIAGRTREKFVFLEQARQQRARFVELRRARARFRADAIAHRLPQQRVRLFLPDQSHQIPRAIRQHDTVDLGVVLHGDEQMIEGFLRRVFRACGEGLFGGVDILAPHRVAQRLAAVFVIVRGTGAGFHRMQHLARAATLFLNPIRVAVQNLEHGQRLHRRRQFLRHLKRGGQRHQRVEAHVILAAERARVGECRGGNERAQIGAGAQTLGQRGQETVGRRFLHLTNERLQRAERERVRGFARGDIGEAEAAGDFRSDRGDEHAAADLGEEFPTSVGSVHGSECGC